MASIKILFKKFSNIGMIIGQYYILLEKKLLRKKLQNQKSQKKVYWVGQTEFMRFPQRQNQEPSKTQTKRRQKKKSQNTKATFKNMTQVSLKKVTKLNDSAELLRHQGNRIRITGKNYFAIPTLKTYTISVV